MQSDGISFCGDVVLNSFKTASRDEDNILHQIYLGKYICSDFYYDDTNKRVVLNPNFMSLFLSWAVFTLICIFTL